MTRFATDTAVVAQGDGRYIATIDPGWWIERGPNGGYLAAIVLRAVLAEVDEPARRARSMTLHYLRPPAAGASEVHVTVERAGRGLTTVSARLTQEGRTCILALVALGLDRPGPELRDHPAPTVAPADEVPAPTARRDGPPIPFRQRYEQRPALGSPPFVRGAEALTGGWIRTTDHDPVDDVLVAAITDAWPPAVFSKLEVPVGVPTVELTIHFRGAPSGAPGWCLVRFRSMEASAGYLDEHGEVWSEDGTLLAESRQLAVLLSPGPA